MFSTPPIEEEGYDDRSMSNTVVKEIYDQARLNRVVIYRRIDGSFGFRTEYFSTEPLEQAWCPYSQFESFCDTAERAETEARGRVDWLRRGE